MSTIAVRRPGLATTTPRIGASTQRASCSPVNSKPGSTRSGTPSGRAASPTRSRSSSRSPTCSSSRRLDDLHTLEENKADPLKQADRAAHLPGRQGRPRAGPTSDLRWSRFKNFAPGEMFTRRRRARLPVPAHAGRRQGSTYAHHMKDARFTIPTPALLAKVVDMLDEIADGGSRHQGRRLRIHARQDRQRRPERPVPHAAPHHRADGRDDGADAEGRDLRSGLRAPAASWWRRANTCASIIPSCSATTKLREHFHDGLFHGFDFDTTMLRIGSMNMMLHGVENPDVTLPRLAWRRSMRRGAGATRWCSPIRRSPAALDYETTAKDLLQIVKTKKTELLFLALFLRLLKTGGRAAVIVPDGVLFGSSKAHKDAAPHAGGGPQARRRDQAAVAACSGPMPACRPRSWCSPRPASAAPITSGSTTCDADGWSLDDKRQPLLPTEKLGPTPQRR